MLGRHDLLLYFDSFPANEEDEENVDCRAYNNLVTELIDHPQNSRKMKKKLKRILQNEDLGSISMLKRKKKIKKENEGDEKTKIKKSFAQCEFWKNNQLILL